VVASPQVQQFRDTRPDPEDGTETEAPPVRPAAACALRCSTEAPRRARGFTRAVLEHWGVTSEAEYEIRAIVSELVTNSVVHSDSETVSLTITLLGRTVCLEVRDTGPWREPKPDPSGERGRGLALVRQQATTSGVHRTPDGTRAWAQRALSEDELPYQQLRPAC
jgi:anti-sigma regulatory factor (Ser/Thr protein kinase)